MSLPYRNSKLNRSYLDKVVANAGPTRAQALTAPAAAEVASVPAPAVRKAAPLSGSDASILETLHPEIARSVSLLWGFPEMNQYFDRLWMADGSHEPIDPDAMSDLMLLSRVHQSLMPERPTRTMASMFPGNRLNEMDALASKDRWSDVPPRR
jgi:hypothetical protein